MSRRFRRTIRCPSSGRLLTLLVPLLLVSWAGPAVAEILFWPARLVFPAGDGPRSVAIDDLNGDQIPDLAVANYTSDDVAVLLGTGGSPATYVVNPEGTGDFPTIQAAIHAAPNPFSSTTVIRYELPPAMEAGQLTLAVYDCAGRLVRTLQDGVRRPGTHRVVWIGDGVGGQPLPSGAYYCHLQLDGVPLAKQTAIILR